MRKLSIFILGMSLIITIAGCLKDKHFEKQEYGVQITDIRGVSLPESPNSPIVKGLNALTTPQTLTTVVHLESADAASEDIAVQLALNPVLVTDAGFATLPVTSFSVNLAVTIPKGSRLAEVVITIPNASLLDPSLTYGVGLSITSVTPSSYKIVSNFKNLVIAFSIKNEWDGQYKVLRSQVNDPNRPTISSAFFGTSPQLYVDLITSGANSNVMEWPDFAPPIKGHAAPLTAGGWTSFGNAQPKYVWNPTTNVMTSVENNMFAAPQNRTFQLIRGKRDPVTKVIVAEYNMLQATFVPVYHYDSLKYSGPR
jgi:hypothetical protein